MSLIEQLGGYEKSKRELKLKEEGSMFQCCTDITAKMIRDALLQYRRENNIFEVWDFIIYGDYELFKIIGIQGRFNLAVQGVNGIPTISVLKKYCRHATDKEIAQGYRDE